jgi:hypothetical protein
MCRDGTSENTITRIYISASASGRWLFSVDFYGFFGMNLCMFSRYYRAMFLVVTLALVALCAFGLGRLSVQVERQPHLLIHPPGDRVGAAVPTPYVSIQPKTVAAGEGNFFASKNGTKYYSTACASGGNIKPENQVWFSTAQDAQAAGYSLATTCSQ